MQCSHVIGNGLNHVSSNSVIQFIKAGILFSFYEKTDLGNHSKNKMSPGLRVLELKWVKENSPLCTSRLLSSYNGKHMVLSIVEWANKVKGHWNVSPCLLSTYTSKPTKLMLYTCCLGGLWEVYFFDWMRQAEGRLYVHNPLEYIFNIINWFYLRVEGFSFSAGSEITITNLTKAQTLEMDVTRDEIHTGHSDITWRGCQPGLHVWSLCLWSPSWCWTLCRPASRRRWPPSPASCTAGTSPSPPATCTHTQKTESLISDLKCLSTQFVKKQKSVCLSVFTDRLDQR